MWVYSLAMSPDGQTFFSGNSKNTIDIWETSTGEKIRTIKEHSSMVFALVMSPDGQTLVSGSSDKTIKIWRSI